MDVELYTNKLIEFSSSVIKQLTSPEAHSVLEYFYKIIGKIIISFIYCKNIHKKEFSKTIFVH